MTATEMPTTAAPPPDPAPQREAHGTDTTLATDHHVDSGHAAVAGTSRAHAPRLHAAFSRLLGSADWRLVIWDGTEAGPRGGTFTLTFHSRRALDRLLGSFPDRGFGRALAAGELDIAPLTPFVALIGRRGLRDMALAWPGVVAAALALGARPDRSSIGPAEARLRGRRHSRERDRKAVAHHYDLPAEFYSLFLDSTLTYSCAYFATPDDDLDAAQRAKLELICRKLRLRRGERLLDVGCGFGGLILHAAEAFGAHCVGITLSTTQAQWARRQISARGLGDRVEIRLADYRDVLDEPFEAVASVGMVEHVGEAELGAFARTLHRALRPRGRLLLHGITRPPAGGIVRGSFIDRFVFPDGELPEAGALITRLQEAGLEVRDVENLREHYALTLERWMSRLERGMEDAMRLAGPQRARIWRLYLAGAAVGFAEDRTRLHQVLAVRPDSTGVAGVPLRREDWYR
jgi:cyclopropane-fatty-acyl-phospholipid synthase